MDVGRVTPLLELGAGPIPSPPGPVGGRRGSLPYFWDRSLVQCRLCDYQRQVRGALWISVRPATRSPLRRELQSTKTFEGNRDDVDRHSEFLCPPSSAEAHRCAKMGSPRDLRTRSDGQVHTSCQAPRALYAPRRSRNHTALLTRHTPNTRNAIQWPAKLS